MAEATSLGNFDISQAFRYWMTSRVAGVLTDPSEITLKVKDPSDNIATYTYTGANITKHATGIFYMDITPDEAGRWYINHEGDGVEGAREYYFDVPATEF